MKVVKQINNNAALALDASGAEVVILGNGVGFPRVPYDLKDLSKIKRTFYDVDPKYIDMIAGIPQAVIMAAAEITEKAEENLECDLNANLSFTLADHLNFVIRRMKEGYSYTSPLSYEVKNLYPKEYRLGVSALQIIKQHTGIMVPEGEITNIALHIIGGEYEKADHSNYATTLQIVQDLNDIIEKDMGIQIDRESFQYERFIMHLRYLILRLSTNGKTTDKNLSLLRTFAKEYPQTYLCARNIEKYFREKWNWKCSEDEVFYLMLHINRVISKE